MLLPASHLAPTKTVDASTHRAHREDPRSPASEQAKPRNTMARSESGTEQDSIGQMRAKSGPGGVSAAPVTSRACLA